MIRVLIADDHAVVRKGVREILTSAFQPIVCGEAQNVPQLLELVRQQSWDLVILDLNLPGRSGLEGLKEIRHERPELPVVIFSMYPAEQLAVRAVKAGAAGYVSKDSAPEELLEALREILAGKKHLSPSLITQLADELGREPNDQPLHHTLSDREYLIMREIASGKTVSEIARQFSLSVKTISTYRSRLLKKLHMKTNAELTVYAIHKSLVE